jgi:HSP20 family protein
MAITNLKSQILNKTIMCNRQAYFMDKMHRHHGFSDHPFHKFQKKYGDHRQVTPANVEEFDDRYVLHVAAPGLDKADFLVSIKDETLVIKATKASKEDHERRWRRREFNSDAIERYFQLSEKIDKNAISATYQDGVLQVSLPKLEGHETVRHQIEVE